MIFVDSDAYIALNFTNDLLHRQAVAKLETLTESEENQLVTSWEVIDEVTTKLSFYISRPLASKFLYSMLSSTTRIEFVELGLIDKVEAIFRSQKSKKVSLTDCANMVIAKKLGVTTFFSFDHHYLQNGFKLL
ncbi:MAG: hypothetical protein UW86_C0026G0002 [Microgenomates group bacterium GW2011_GWA1_Microgenomates_45_10]|nr:MAG: hypothetical protein UW69_C0015G0020 [Microgenomates group bacterium GW2011_GWA2_44_7]KKT77908.1 MAG: hypothetical protein UW73_C0009G0007 [Microgenomates group bacterium GW2011_GWB1_44_8]KKT86638.1 MAG: hypothetical protein UW86_C0026G0002 [Microgenomates group bacterium GW2011_GWA1_Microgenomates_45_10]